MNWSLPRFLTRLLVRVPARHLFRLRIRAWSLLVGALSAFLAGLTMQEARYHVSLSFGLITICASLLEFLIADVWTERLYPAKTAALLDRLVQKRATFHSEVMRQLRFVKSRLRGCTPESVSGTVHLSVEFYGGDKAAPELGLVQLTEYEGGLGGKPYRVLSATKGIVGRALRTGKCETVSFASLRDYETRMVAEFGFTKQEAAKLTTQARSYLAAPILSDGEVLGVLFLFSTEPQAFPHALPADDLDIATNALAVCLRSIELVPTLRVP